MNVEMASRLAQRTGRLRALAASVIFVAMLLAALSLWTAIPLSWIYIGSKVSDTQFPSGGPYVVVAVGIIVSILLIAWLIGRLNRPLHPHHRHQPAGADAADLAEEHARHLAAHRHHHRRRGGADGLGHARRPGA